jgi:hypothetical protein
LRSARRLAHLPGNGDRFTGFRLALGQTSSKSKSEPDVRK